MKRKRRSSYATQYRLSVLENNVRWRDLYFTSGPLVDLEREMEEHTQRITQNGNGGTVILFDGLTPLHRVEVPPQPRTRRKRRT